MSLTKVERMSAVMLARTVASNAALYEVTNELGKYIQKLNSYGIYTVAEISEFTEISEYRVRKYLLGAEEIRAKSGVLTRHLDHYLRMIGAPDFTKKHLPTLLSDGVGISTIARITGHSQTTLRRWVREE